MNAEGSSSSSQPRKNLVDALEPRWAGFNNEEIDKEFPKNSPVDDDDDDDTVNIVEGESSNDQHSTKKGKEPDRGDVEMTKKEKAKSEEDSIEEPSGFFRLPYDVRQLIYRNLLRSDEPIAAGTGGDFHGDYEPDAQGHGLQPQILETCRQIKSECQDMLFDDNVFELSIWDLYENHVMDHRCNPTLTQFSFGRSRKFPLLKRVEVVIDRYYNAQTFQLAIFTTARVLTQQMSKLTHLSIKVEPDVPIGDPRWELRGLSMIRNVRKAVVEGVEPPELAQSLTESMIIVSPLPQMYYDLEFFAGSIDCVEDPLREAWEAVALRNNFQAFVEARARVIKAVKEHMKHAELHLFNHDPVPPITSEKCSESTGCQHCCEPKSEPRHDLDEEGDDGFNNDDGDNGSNSNSDNE